MDEEGQCIRIGKGQPEPREPSPAEVNRHNLTNLPYRSWCPHCVAARRANAPHKQGSRPREKPLFCSDYCFVGDTRTEADNLTVLVGKLYPPKALFAVVCECKGAGDAYAVSRLCQFLRECGVKDLVYKSDQEASIIALVNEVLRRSQLPGDAYFGLLNSAVPENSAVGESASNSRAERSVQTFEDMLRTYKSALDARMGEHLPSNHAIMYWLSEHAASTYNKCFVQADGKTPYEFLHGKAPGLRLIEFGEKVMWHVPKKLRVKLDLRWRLGVFSGPVSIF